MDILVQTGHTKTASGTSLVALSFPSSHGEQAILLLQIEASAREAKTLEEEAVSIIQNSLLGTEGDLWQRLDGALKELNGLFKGLLVAESVENIHAIVAVVDRSGALHVSHAGSAEGYLVRRGTASQITEPVKGKASPVFVHISSGQIESRDRLAFSTQRLLRSMTPAQIARAAERQDQFLTEITLKLEEEKELAALATIDAPAHTRQSFDDVPQERPTLASRRHGRRTAASGIRARALRLSKDAVPVLQSAARKTVPFLQALFAQMRTLKKSFLTLLSDLKHPERKRRAHMLLLAGAVAAFLLIWMVVRLSTFSQRSKTRVELEELMEQIEKEIQVAENRRLTGDRDSANAILERAQQRAQQVMDDDSKLFRTEALDLLEQIRSKREEINNIVRLAPRVAANVSAKNSSVSAQGLIGIQDSELAVYDRQAIYRILSNAVDDPETLFEGELLLDGAYFRQYRSFVFLTNMGSVLEAGSGPAISMKTDDPEGWESGKDIETYLRYLYVLSPEKNQIYKYERLANRYAVPVEYNINGSLQGSLDMAIDGSVYVLKDDGTIVKLLRGETQPFVIRHGPEDLLQGVTRLYKVIDGHFYFLDPEGASVSVVTDGGATGEASYVKQYVLEGDQLGILQDLYVDPEEAHLYVLDEKRVYVVDLEGR